MGNLDTPNLLVLFLKLFGPHAGCLGAARFDN